MALHDPQTGCGSRFPVHLIVATNLLLLSTIVLSAARGQEPEDIIRIRTDLVVVPLAVTDSRGRRIPDLKSNDFQLTDDGRDARIDYFASGTDRVALLFALAASGSARDIFAQQREAAIALFSRFGRGSRVAVLHFGDFVRLTVPFTTNSAPAQRSCPCAT